MGRTPKDRDVARAETVRSAASTVLWAPVRLEGERGVETNTRCVRVWVLWQEHSKVLVRKGLFILMVSKIAEGVGMPEVGMLQPAVQPTEL